MSWDGFWAQIDARAVKYLQLVGWKVSRRCETAGWDYWHAEHPELGVYVSAVTVRELVALCEQWQDEKNAKLAEVALRESSGGGIR